MQQISTQQPIKQLAGLQTASGGISRLAANRMPPITRQQACYLPAEDRRHYVAWSELKKADFADDYWSKLWDWYNSGGDQHVAPRIWLNLILHPLTLKRRRPRPKPSGTSLMPTGLLKILSLLTCSIRWVIPEPRHFKVIPKAMTNPFKMWLQDRKNRRAIPHRFEQCGYAPVRNPDREDGLWKVPVQPVDATLGVRLQ